MADPKGKPPDPRALEGLSDQAAMNFCRVLLHASGAKQQTVSVQA
jgi:hypothetical protein